MAYEKENVPNYLKLSVIKPPQIFRRGGGLKEREDGYLKCDQRFLCFFSLSRWMDRLLFSVIDRSFSRRWRWRRCEHTASGEWLPAADVTRTPPWLVPRALNPFFPFLLIRSPDIHTLARFLLLFRGRRRRKKRKTHTHCLNGWKEQLGHWHPGFYGSPIRHPTQLLLHLRPLRVV